MGRVAGAILHEIRQALQPFETYVALARHRLQQNAPPAEVLDAVSRLAKATQSINALTKTNLYNLQKTRRQTVQINQRILEIVGWYEPRAQRHDLLLKCELPKTPITLSLPPEALEQPLANLLDNAFHHFGERKWGIITVRVGFDLNKPIHPVSIEVNDQGQGMTAEQRQSLFIPRVSAKGIQGHGLGLYTSRQLLRAVGGDLECMESWRWLGSTFRIRLPYKVDKN
jgi:C4-dicarboxylate-specific signal transduction histidine kinase